MLLIFHAIRRHDFLRWICNEKVDFERVQETVILMMDWIRDAKQVDGTGEWGLKMVEPLFEQHLRWIPDRK